MRAVLKFRAALAAVLLMVLAAAYSLAFTTHGMAVLAQEFTARYFGRGEMSIGTTSGSLVRGAQFSDISFRGILPQLNFPVQGLIRQAKTDPLSLHSPYIRLQFKDGKIMLPGDQVLRFYGDYAYPLLEMTVYSEWFSLGTILQLCPPLADFRSLEGMLADLDIAVTSSVTNPRIKGSFIIDEGAFRGFLVKKAACTVDLSGERQASQWKLTGHVAYKGGVLLVRNTVIDLEEGTITFSGDPSRPAFLMKGTSTVGSTKITIKLTGTAIKPSLELYSSPPLPQDRLLAMLVTANPLKGLDESASQGRLSPDLVKDFVDYFFLGGTGGGLSKKLGITDISLQYDQNSQGVIVSKSLTGTTQLKFGVSQARNSYNQTVTGGISRNLTVEQKLSDTLSIEGSGDFSPVAGGSIGNTTGQQDSTFQLKLKKTF